MKIREKNIRHRQALKSGTVSAICFSDIKHGPCISNYFSSSRTFLWILTLQSFISQALQHLTNPINPFPLPHQQTTPTITMVPLPPPSIFSPTNLSQSIRSIKQLIPLLDRVLIQRIKPETKTASGIFLPESSVKELNEAKVLAVGPGLINKDGKRLEMGVKAGDKVLIPQYGGSPIKVGEEEFSLFRDSE